LHRWWWWWRIADRVALQEGGMKEEGEEVATTGVVAERGAH